MIVDDMSHCGQEGDGLVTIRNDVALLVRTADCAPIALASAEGVTGVAHGGWRGLLDGVVDATAAAMRRLGATLIHAGVGPCIHPCCYSFGAADLDRVARSLGDSVRGTDAEGRPALDLPAAVRVAAAQADVELIFESPACTGCESDRFWSHRVRGEPQRQGVLAWRN